MPARTGGHATVTQPDRDEPGLYLSTGQPVEVVRIRLAPGEGYIVSTEYLLHDGSTEAANAPSAAAFWLGQWP